MKGIIIKKPDDMHFHPRQGEMLRKILRYTSSIFSRGIIMGNLFKPIVTASDAENHQQEILSVDSDFNPLMTIMLKKSTTPEIIREAFNAGIRLVKYMPDAATTNSSDGIRLDKLLDECAGIFEEIQDLGMFLLGHWTLPKAGGNFLDELEEERNAIPYLEEIIRRFPNLNITVEHVSTGAMVDFVIGAPENVVATITCHHAIASVTGVLDCLCEEIINPFNYCKPILNYPSDSMAVYRAMISGNPKFFFGSDSAPHLNSAKMGNPPAAGIFSAPVAIPILCKLFELSNEMRKLEDFVSRFGAEHYHLPLNEGEITIRKERWIVPEEIEGIKVFLGGQTLNWRVV